MLNYGIKIDNDDTSAGSVVADEYNSLMQEQKNSVTPFLSLNAQDNKQQAKAIDIASKAMFYVDTGTVNAVALSRGATTEVLETLFDGMVIIFTPANANTGATTLKVKNLTAKPLKYNGADLTAGYLKKGLKYIATYDLANDKFDVDIMTLGLELSSMVKELNGIAVSLGGKNLTGNIGDVIIRPSNSIPNDYLECNGAELSRTTYADLFAVISDTYGAGDGSTTFNLPDLRGEFIRGFDNGRGIDSGRAIGTSQADEFKSHNHGYQNNTIQSTTQPGSANGTRDIFYTDTTSSSGGTETRPRNIAMMYCIKY